MLDFQYGKAAQAVRKHQLEPNHNGSGKDHVMDNVINERKGSQSQTPDAYDSRRKWKNPSSTKTYHAWRNMRRRCSNPNDESWYNYGGRGISVCERWQDDYDAFVSDMGLAPDGLTLDRIDVEGDYEPGNCRWVGWNVQANNKRTNTNLTHNGKTQTATQWATELGIGTDTLHRRLNVYGMDVVRALTAGSLVPEVRCGTRTGYEGGCRCDGCRAAHAKAYRERRASHAQRLMDEITPEQAGAALTSIGGTPRAYWAHANEWVGRLIHNDLGFDLESTPHRRAIKGFIDRMLADGLLVEAKVADAKGRPYTCVKVAFVDGSGYMALAGEIGMAPKK